MPYKYKYFKQATSQHNNTKLYLAAQHESLNAMHQIIAEMTVQMNSTRQEFDSEVAEIRVSVSP
jgi:predicted double-glycine peptidase